MDSVQSMASSSSSTVPSSRGTSLFVSQTKMEMEFAEARHWTELNYSTTDSELSAESNLKYFDLLTENPKWGRFFTDFEALEVGENIAKGAQSYVFEARKTRDGPFDLVVKVMKGGNPLESLQRQWPVGMLSARSKYKHLFDLPLISILGGTMLRDKRLRGRFAFVMYRRWGDLRLLIDRRMKQKRSTSGPFPIDQAIHLMSSIAGDMNVLHDKHGIVHRDLKASNVLVWGEFCEDLSLIDIPNRVEKIKSVVADFECSVGVVGTSRWMAPEIKKQLKAGVPPSEVQLTRASDVYSYGMTCYEIVTGCIPSMDMTSQILQGRCPDFPHDLPEFVRNIIFGCWHLHPSKRPEFSAICKAFEMKRAPNPMFVVVDNKSECNGSAVKVENWHSHRAFTLAEVIQKLMDFGLSVLEASDSSSNGMIMQYLEVVDRRRRKVVKDDFIAKIRLALLKPESMVFWRPRYWMNHPWEMPGTENTSPEKYIVKIIANRSGRVLHAVLGCLIEFRLRVHSAKSWTRKGRLECVIYVGGPRMCSLSSALCSKLEFSPALFGRFMVLVQRVATEEFLHLGTCLRNLKSLDLTRPRNLNTCVRLRMDCMEDCRTEVTVCLQNREFLADVSKYMVFKDSLVVEASIEYPVASKLLNRGRNIEDIDIGTLGGDESEKIFGIFRLIDEERFHGDNLQLVISGSSGVVHSDLIRRLDESRLISGGQVCSGIGMIGNRRRPEHLFYFVTEKPGGGAS